MDMTSTVAAKSDQLNADDLIGGARTFTVEKVTPGPSEQQPVNFHLSGLGQPWRPSKTMRRILVAVWGAESDNYIGQSVTLFRDPTVVFGGIEVGGIVISHMTGLPNNEPQTFVLTAKKGQKKPVKVLPLTQAAPKNAPTEPEPVDEAKQLRLDIWHAIGQDKARRDELATEWSVAHPGETLKDTQDVEGLKALLAEVSA